MSLSNYAQLSTVGNPTATADSTLPALPAFNRLQRSGLQVVAKSHSYAIPQLDLYQRPLSRSVRLKSTHLRKSVPRSSENQCPRASAE